MSVFYGFQHQEGLPCQFHTFPHIILFSSKFLKLECMLSVSGISCSDPVTHVRVISFQILSPCWFLENLERIFSVPAAGHCCLFHIEECDGFPGSAVGKELARRCRRRGLHPWVGEIPWSRK